MKCTIPEISWHNREPVLSVDIHPVSNDCYRLASGGGDCHVLIWQANINENGAINLEAISDLTRHQKAINAVRWSPSGQYLATGDDDACIFVWQLKTDNIPLLEGDTGDKETWIIYKVLRGHKEDIYDLCWSPCSLKLLSGSVDNSAIIWDITKGKLEHILSDHKGFVQGVAWDPKQELLATISTDRLCRIFDKTGKHVKQRILKGKLPVPSDHYLHEKDVKFFHDDTFKSFFRRMEFSPDGSMLVAPSGHFEADDTKRILNATLIFTLDNWKGPAAILPLHKQCSTVVRFCPLLFELRDKGPEPLINLPYRMIVAVGTDHDLIIYDTQQAAPCARFQDIHYTRLTDLTWSSDGLLLIASSTDGFCSVITFDPKELGTIYVKEASEANEVAEDTEKEEEPEKVGETTENEIEKPKRPSFLLQWAKKPKTENTQEKKNNVKEKEKINVLTPKRITPTQVQDNNKNDTNPKEKINVLIPKRIKPISITENKEHSSSVSKKTEINITNINSNPTKNNCTKPNVEQNNKEIKNVEANTNKVNKHSDAKPIAVRRKPKPVLEDKSTTEKSKINDHSDAKPIEVRRKPRVPEVKESINVLVEPKHIEPKKDMTEPEVPEVKQPITTATKLIEVIEILDSPVKPEIVITPTKSIKRKLNELDSTPSRSDTENNTPGRKKAKEANSELDSTPNKSDSQKSTPSRKKVKEVKSDTTPKSITPKTTPGRKKQNDTEQITPSRKANTLLNFLKLSAEKQKEKKESKKKIPVVSIDLTDGNEARDAWNTEKESVNSEKECSDVKTLAESDKDDDCTEDFCLQLEDTQPTKEKENGKEVMKEKENEDKLTSLNKPVEKMDTSDDSNDSTKVKDNLLKVPRRIPLITLASPKSKKKS